MVINEDVPLHGTISAKVPLAVPRAALETSQTLKFHAIATQEAVHVTLPYPWRLACPCTRQTIRSIRLGASDLSRTAATSGYAVHVGLERPARRVA